MKIGLMIATAGAADLNAVLGQIERAQALGLASVWVPSVRSFDALTVLALAGRQTRTVELGTFVIPTYPRHPAALAEQALAVQAAWKPSDSARTICSTTVPGAGSSPGSGTIRPIFIAAPPFSGQYTV